MLQLQLKSFLPKLPRKHIFLLKLLFFSIIVHIILLSVVLCIRNTTSSCISLATLPDGASIVLVPLMKTVPQALQQKPSSSSSPQPAVIKSTMPLKQPQKKAVPKKVVTPPKKNTRSAAKKNEPKKKTVPLKNTVQASPKKVPPVQKKPVEKKIIEMPVTSLALTTTLHVVDTKIEIGREDNELIHVCNYIKQDIARQWKRPTNIPTTAECHIKVHIDDQGKREVIITQSSYALALDIMVKNFIMHYAFPKELWNKELELIF